MDQDTLLPEALDQMEDNAFRLHVRRWIEANYPPEMRFPRRRMHWHENKPWYMALSRQGWLAPNWPREYGGMGLGATKQLIMIEELERHGCARVSDMGLIMLGPMLIKHGTEEQKQRFLPRILSGEDIWCQGYSEPNAGSDLAALRLDAADAGDHWVLNGQKTWITLANDANWILCSPAPTNRARSSRAFPSCCCQWMHRASRCGRSSTSTCMTSSARSSSTMSACPRTWWWARSTRAGPMPRRCWASSASPSAPPSSPPTGWRG
ncbi:acyl-CoA dehydrogenase family protein [Pseudoroseomonas wenyumeiae]